MRTMETSSSILTADFSKAESVVGAVNNIWKFKDIYKHNLERYWYRDVAWYLGHQNLIWNSTRKNLEAAEVPSYRARIVVNLIQPLVRTLAAKLYKAAPEWDVLPARTDTDSLHKAQIAKQVLENNWYNLRMPEKMLDTLLWTVTTGNCFVKQTWNPDKGLPIPVPEGLEDFEPDEMLFTGDIEADVTSPFKMIVDPNAETFRDALWCLETNLVHIEELKQRFPNAKKIDSASGRNTRLAQWGERIKSLTNPNSGGAAANFAYNKANYNQDVVPVHELWIKPLGKGRLDKGKFIVIAEDQVLSHQEFPYHHGELPYVHFQEIPIPGRVWGTSTLQQLIPVQQSYNRTKSQLMDNRNLISNPKWFIPRGSGIKNSDLTSRPGEKVEYVYPLKPELSQPTEIPSYVERTLNADRFDLEDISGIHEASRAEAPGQIRSGAGVYALVEQDETRLAPVTRQIEQSTQRLGVQNLSLTAQFVTEERLSRSIGPNDELVAFSYTGKSLVGRESLPGLNYFDVRVRTVAGLPMSRAAQHAMLNDLINSGVYKPSENEQHRQEVLRLLDLGSTQAHLDQSRVHRSKQLQEVAQMGQGMQVRVESWHDHDIHLDELNKFRNSASYDMLSTEVKTQLELHAQSHKQYKAMALVEPELLVQQAASLMTGQNAQGVPDEGQQEQVRPQRQRSQDQRADPQAQG